METTATATATPTKPALKTWEILNKLDNLVIDSDNVTVDLLKHKLNELNNDLYDSHSDIFKDDSHFDDYKNSINAARLIYPDEWFSLNQSWHFDNSPQYLVINGEKVQYVLWGQGNFNTALFLKFEDVSEELLTQLKN